ncbi:MAG: aromatic amino acid lyase [Proteobacteria bacterium]|nr:aromatic amino acid lyase [Pseudomonadota bacterium]MCP4915736.1 aromatic amino acid lyase [Pseudomonadota bacterium]
MTAVSLTGQNLDLRSMVGVARRARRVGLDADSRLEMGRSRAWVEDAVAGRVGDGAAIYGVNTGYGSLARVRIPAEKLDVLSRNLVRSHAAGVGAPLPRDVARATVLLRANALSRGRSGCRPELVELLIALLNAGIDPWLPSQGSCGSSGDLAPLAHLALIIGHDADDPDEECGSAWIGDQLLSGRQALASAGLESLSLGPKEGLALTNGAQVTTAVTALALADSIRLVQVAEIAAALSIEALRGVTRAFRPEVHAMRPYPGAVACASNLLRLLDGSELVDSVEGKVQDAYALRCTPVVLGSVRDSLRFVHQQVAVELNAVTDNPLILVDADGDDKAFSAGLFHGEPIGMAADLLKIAVSELASLSERRLYRLTTGALSVQLPASLRGDGAGVGLLALQTSAAALVSENKALGFPASVDSIPTCEDQEDHVAMSTTASRRAAEVVENAQRVVAIELLCAHRALSHRLEAEPGMTLGAGTYPAWQALSEALEGATHETPAELVRRIEPLVAGPALEDVVEARIGGLARGIA